MVEREHSTLFEVLRAFAILVPVTVAVYAAELWATGEWTEAAEFRVTSCTVNEVSEGASYWGINSVAVTAECGQLVIPRDVVMTPPRLRKALDGPIEAGHRYRLVLGEVDPPLEPPYQRIVRIIAVEHPRQQPGVTGDR
ncbi:hypothetical protein [Pseudonocardia sp. DLS-67]